MQLQNQSEKINETRQIVLEVKVEVDQKIKCLEEEMKTKFSTMLEESQKSLKDDLMVELESMTAKKDEKIMELIRVQSQEIEKIKQPIARLESMAEKHLEVFRQQWPVRLKDDSYLQKALNANIHKTVVDLIDSSRLQLDPNAKLIQEWKKYNDYSGWWLIGQVNEQGQPHGVARMISVDGWYIREGSFVNGKLTGFGREIDVGQYYIGEWKDNNIHGQGR